MSVKYAEPFVNDLATAVMSNYDAIEGGGLVRTTRIAGAGLPSPKLAAMLATVPPKQVQALLDKQNAEIQRKPSRKVNWEKIRDGLGTALGIWGLIRRNPENESVASPPLVPIPGGQPVPQESILANGTVWLIGGAVLLLVLVLLASPGGPKTKIM